MRSAGGAGAGSAMVSAAGRVVAFMSPAPLSAAVSMGSIEAGAGLGMPKESHLA